MVFLLGRMGNNKKALTLIIERLGDVHRVCLNLLSFRRIMASNSVAGHRLCKRAKRRRSMGRSINVLRNTTGFVCVLPCLPHPSLSHYVAFIRGLLENIGVEISPIRLIRRIKNGLEIPGLKEALIKILQDFHLQISLLEGCQTILNGDSSDLSRALQRNQSSGFFLSGKLSVR